MRASGILMPIFSLSSEYGIGTFGKSAYDFIDFLEKAGQTYWQILPIGPTGFGDSPYQSFSTFAGNPYFIDLNFLCRDGYLSAADIRGADFGNDPSRVDYGKLYENRKKILKKAHAAFVKNPAADYFRFLSDNAFWLDDYALYCAIKNDFNCALKDFPENLRSKKRCDIKSLSEKYREEIEYIKTEQYFFFKQWGELKKYAAEKGIKIIGDIPIYVSPDSADLWANPQIFLLDENSRPTLVAGTPPDAFSDEGQLWGNPLYDWETLKATDYDWWIKRVEYYGRIFDVVRIDHFRAFDEYFAIKAGESAKNGKWQPGPGKDFIDALNRHCPNVEIIAEDLGTITESTVELLNYGKYRGMAVLQFAFDPNSDSKYLPHNIGEHTVVYTGTHDNDTVNGYMKNIDNAEFEFCTEYLRLRTDEGYNWGMIKAAMATAAEICIIPMQDFMGLDSAARINTPSTSEGNWQWRILDGCVNDWLAGIIRNCTGTYRRCGNLHK